MTTFVDKEVLIGIVHHVYDDDLQQVLAIMELLVGQLDDTCIVIQTIQIGSAQRSR